MSASANRWLTVWVRDLPLAFPLEQVNEVLLWVPWQPAPPQRRGIVGIISLRGDDWPVWDLGQFWGLRPRAPDRETCLVLMNRSDGGKLGAVVVDRVGNVVEGTPNDSLGSAGMPGMPFRRTVVDGETGTEHLETTLIDLLGRSEVASGGA